MIEEQTNDASKFNPLFPPPVWSTVDDDTLRSFGLGKFYTLCGDNWCDLPTSSWRKDCLSNRWIREE